MPLYGFDAVNVNTTSSAAFADKFYRFAIVKSTEGQGWKNTAYPALKKLARDNGKLFGAYHYAWTVQDPVLEAQNFVAYSALEPGDVAVLDIERQNEMPPSTDPEAVKAWWRQAINFSLVWLSEVEAVIGTKPWVYINNYWRNNLLANATAEQRAKLITYPLWLSEPGANNTAKTAGFFTSNTDWPALIHQYHFITGIDKNWFGWTEDVWNVYAIPAPPAPPTTLESLIDEVKNMSAAMSSKFTTVNTTLDGISGVAGAALAKADANNASINQLVQIGMEQNVSLSTIVDSCESIDTNIVMMDEGLTSMLDGVTVDIAGVGSKIDALPEGIKTNVNEALSGFSLTVTYPNK